MPKNVAAAPLSQRSTTSTTRDVANHYRVSLRTIQNWRDQRLIPFVRINSRVVRYNLDEIERAFRK